MRAGLSCTRRSAPLHEAANKGLCATQLFSFIGSVAEVNVSLGGKAYLLDIFTDIYNCSWSKRDFEFVIQRADGETERYNDYMYVTDDGYGSFRHYISHRGLWFGEYCGLRWCEMYISISPTDFQYDGAQISGGIYFSECFNTTSPITLNIQGRIITQMVYSGTSK